MNKRRRFGPRGFDFYVKWSVGNWAEEITYRFGKEVLASRLELDVFRYGYSAGRIPESLEEFEKILEEREKLEYGKRPNFLIFREDFASMNSSELSTLMRRPEKEVEHLVREAVAAIEVEQSMWCAKKARQAKKKLSFTVKEEDLPGLYEWKEKYHKKIIIFQIFLDELHGTLLEDVISKGNKRKERKTHKVTYYFPISEDTRLADIEKVEIETKAWFTKEGQLIPFVVFKGGMIINENDHAIKKLFQERLID